MTKLPDCPRCGDDELWADMRGSFITIKCYECGWSSDIKLPLTVDGLSAAIAATVEAARQPRPEDAQGAGKEMPTG